MTRRSLWPREHGAYFQLAIPLATACLLRPPSLATIALTAAACLAFLAHEPLLVVLGHRGPRLRDSAGPRARMRLAGLTIAAIASAGAGLALGADGTVLVAGIASLPAAAVLALAWRRAEHSVAGELVAAIALTGASAPVLVAGGAARGAALATWLGWSLGFGATVVAVHRVIARHKRAATRIDRILAAALVAIAIACGAVGLRAPAIAIAAPLVVLAAILVVAPPAASRLRMIGIAIVIAALGASVLALLAVTT